MTNREQLEQWVAGNPQHNHVLDECCPDFSCCRPELLAPEHERRAFQKANAVARAGMLGPFIERAVALRVKIYVAGDHGEEH